MDGYTNARRAYTESSILTAPPERLVVMLYDGAIRFLTQAVYAQRAGDVKKFNEGLRRGQAIIDELNITLDMGQGSVSERLRAIYLFSKRQLVEAQLRFDAEAIERVVGLLAELREAWDALANRRQSVPAA